MSYKPTGHYSGVDDSAGTPRVDTLRAARSKLDDILDALDRGQLGEGESERVDATHRYRKRLSVTVTQPGGSKATFDVMARSLDTHSLSFLHGGYLHLGSECTLQLITMDNAWQTVTAVVAECHHLGGRLHEVTARLLQPVDVDEFVSAPLSGNVLLVDDAPDFAALTAHHLTQAGLQVTTADRGLKALKLVQCEAFDVILMDVDMPGLDGPAVTRSLRERQVTVPVIALSADDTPEARQRCQEAGCNEFVAKPVDRQTLADVIRRYLATGDALVSKFDGNPATRVFIDEFVSHLPRRIEQMQASQAKGDAAELLRLTRQLKAIAGGSGGCGFDEIADAAARIEHALAQGVDWEQIGAAMSKVASLARRVSASGPTKPVAAG